MSENILKDKELDDMIKNSVIPEQELDQICTDLEFANDLFKVMLAGVSEYTNDNTVEYALYSLWDRYDCLIKQLRDTLKTSNAKGDVA